MKPPSKKTTHFGFTTVSCCEKTKKVGQVFDSVAKKYDLMNDLMSWGWHRVWKQIAVNLAHIRRGHQVLDLASGTGDLASKISSLVGDEGEVILSDINPSMLTLGRDRLLDLGCNHTPAILADAQSLPFKEHTFDRIMVGFGLRNMTDKEQALKSMYDCLKPGGCCLVLEFSKPQSSVFNSIYRFYLQKVLPQLGQWVANDAASYQYLAESILVHPNQKKMKQMIEQAGFECCDVYNLTGGIVAIHRGFKL